MKVSKDKMVLYLPFDDDMRDRAYNYAPSRSAQSDGELEGVVYSDDAVSGQSIHLKDNDGHSALVNVRHSAINMAGEWTVAAFVKTMSEGLQLYVAGGDEVHRHFHPCKGEWVFCAFVHYQLNGQQWRIRIMVEGNVVYDSPCPVTPECFAIGDTNYMAQDCYVDELMAWNRALSLVELLTLRKRDEDVEYFINGKNFKEFGVEVSKSSGLFDLPEIKDPLKVAFDDYHGEVVDLHDLRVQPREITLECFITASDNLAFVEWCRRFMNEFRKNGERRFSCVYGSDAKPLVYDVYVPGGVEIDKTWNQQAMVGTFSVVLREPNPVKKVLRHISDQANSYAKFRINTSKMVDVSWGEEDDTCETSTNGSTWTPRTRSSNLSGDIYVRHKYANAGEYDILIKGVIEKINSFSASFGSGDQQTNEIVVWNKL